MFVRKCLYLGSNTLNNEAVFHVEFLINGIVAKFPVDSGATLSLVLDDLLEKNKLCDRRSVRHVTQESEVANGESLKRIVKALFSVRLGNFYTAVAGIITRLSVEFLE